MARKVSLSAAEALMLRKKMASHNTKVVIDDQGNAHMYLFGNRIAVNTKDDRLFITTAGWDTVTTRSRLREIANVQIRKSGGSLSINGETWDGRWIEVLQASPVIMLCKNQPPND